MVRLPDTLDEYYRGAAKRFSHIQEMVLEYDAEDTPAEETGGRLGSDFALLRAFLADHEGSLFVRLSFPDPSLDTELYFPSYLYGFVEDTFARAIHHKIEGPGFACRECVGKYELRLREYDGLFRLVGEDEFEAGVWMALCRLRRPVGLAESHQKQYEQYLQEQDQQVLALLAEDPWKASEALAYLLERTLLSPQAIEAVLPGLSETRHAQMVAMLLGSRSKHRKRKRFVI